VRLLYGIIPCAALLATALGQWAAARELPIPPIPPADHPSSAPAPMPDDSVRRPIAEASTGPSVALRFYRAPVYAPGSAFAPGSQFQTPEDRKLIQTPGFSVSVPLK
jgi:hypothetical protein